MAKNMHGTAPATSDAQRKATNLRVLQRLDVSIDDLVGSATYVVVYEFKQQGVSSVADTAGSSIATMTANAPTNNGEWEKCDIEGSLFIASTRDKKYKLIVLNRNSTRNMVVPLEKTFQISSEKPFLIFRCSSQDTTIHGIWFHKDNERSTTHDLMQRILSQLEVQQENLNDDNNNTAKPTTTEINCAGLDKGLAASLLLSPMEPSAAAEKQQQELPPASTSNNVMVLDKKNLQLSLLSLIQDERFIDLIHAQYVKIAQARRGGNSSSK